MDRFAACLAFTLREEGPPSNDPGDPGGTTYFGCDQNSWVETLQRLPADACSRMPNHVRDLTPALAAAVYRHAFWDFARCGELPAGLDLTVFDCTVNPGPTWGPRALQRALDVDVDGDIGPLTMAAVQACKPADIIKSVWAQRCAWYRSRAGFWDFGKGWLARANRCLNASLESAAGNHT